MTVDICVVYSNDCMCGRLLGGKSNQEENVGVSTYIHNTNQDVNTGTTAVARYIGAPVVVASCDAAAAAAHNATARSKRRRGVARSWTTCRCAAAIVSVSCMMKAHIHYSEPFPCCFACPVLSRSFSYILVLLGSHCIAHCLITQLVLFRTNLS